MRCGVVAAACAAAVCAAACGAQAAGSRPSAGAPTVLSGPGSVSRWAYVLQPAASHIRPAGGSPTAGPVPDITSDGVPNLVHVVAERADASGARWVEVALTALPNGRVGWVPRGVLGSYHVVQTRLVIDTRRLELTLFRRGRRIFTAPIGVGQPQWPTPRGTFYVRERLSNFHDAAYGPVAFGTNARSTTLTEWPGGGIVGIHGTDAPSLIPGRISHGCVRLRDPDILALARLLPLGTPVDVR